MRPWLPNFAKYGDICDPPYDFRDKGDSMLSTSQHDMPSTSNVRIYYF